MQSAAAFVPLLRRSFETLIRDSGIFFLAFFCIIFEVLFEFGATPRFQVDAHFSNPVSSCPPCLPSGPVSTDRAEASLRSPSSGTKQTFGGG